MNESVVRSHSRKKYLDIAKGIAIIWVTLVHSCGIIVFRQWILAFFLPLFFIISGYTTKERFNDIHLFSSIKKRGKGILIPYFKYSLCLAVLYVIKLFLGGSISIRNVLIPIIGVFYSRYRLFPSDDLDSNIIFLEMWNHPFWFLSAMFISSVIFYFIIWKFDIRKKIILAIIFMILIIITIVFHYLPILLPWSIDTAFLCAGFILIGYWLSLNAFFEKFTLNRWSTFLLVLLTIVFILSCKLDSGCNLALRIYGTRGNLSVLLYAFNGILGSILFLLLCRYLEKVKVFHIFSIIGKYTIQILCFHVLGFYIIDKLISSHLNLEQEGILNYVYGLVKNLLVITSICIISFFWEKKKVSGNRIIVSLSKKSGIANNSQ